MLTRKALLAAAASVLAFMPAAASADTLEEALRLAYGNNPSVEVARALARANDELVTQAEAAYGPSITLNASHRYTFLQTTLASGTTFNQNGFATTGSVGLAQPLFSSGRLAAGLDSAEALAMSAREDLRDASQLLVLDVIGAYISVQRDLQLYAVASQTYDLLRQQNELTARRLDLRDATAPDADQTLNRAEFAASRVILARADLEESAASYRSLVGKYPDNLAPAPPLPPLPDLETLYATLETTNPRVRSAQFRELATRAQLAGARADMGPQVSADVIASRSPNSPFANAAYGEQVAAGVSVSIPLYAGGLLSARVREAIQRNIAGQQQVEAERRDARNVLAADYAQWRAAREALPRLQAAVEAAERAVTGVQQQETAGIRTLRDVIDVTNDLFNARSNLAAAEAELYFRHASVLQRAGLLTIDLFAPGAEYDPESYDPAGAALAGLPFEPVLEPIDALLVRDDVDPVTTLRETDNVYEDGAELSDPPRP